MHEDLHLHQSPLRRSPRNFLSPPPQSESPKQKQPNQHLAITPLHEDEHNNLAQLNSPLRRSPRQHPHLSNLDLAFASFLDPQPLNVCRPQAADKVLLVTSGHTSLRRSPRFASSGSNGGDSAQCKSKCGGNNGKRKSDCLESSIEVRNKRVKRSDFQNSEFPMFSASKSESEAESGVKLAKQSPLTLIKSVHCEEIEGKSKNSESVRRSPRFSDVKSETRAQVEGKLRRNPTLKLIKSPECKEIEGNSRNSEFVKRSPRLSDLKSGCSPLKLIKSAECKEIEGNSEFTRRSLRFSASKSESIAEIEVKSSKQSPLKLIKLVECKKIEAKTDNSEFVRRSRRFSALKSESLAENEVELDNNLRLKLIKSKECEEIESISVMKSPNLLMAENLDEEKVLRRSPRGLPSSFAVEDDFEDLGFGFSLKKKTTKKKKVPKEEPKVTKVKSNGGGKSENCFFVGDAVNVEEALRKWGWRYQLKNRRVKGRSLTGNAMEEDEPILEVKCHYTQAQIRGHIFHLGDCVLIRGEGKQKHIGKIVEFLETMDGEDYFRAQWFYKPEDTVMKEAATFHDKKRIFYSSIMNDNLLACIISKLNVIQVASQLNLNTSSIELADFYYDMEYCLDYSTFRNLPRDPSDEGCILSSLSCPESILSLTSSPVVETKPICESYNAELTVLDLYAGCGAMSTGLCTGAKLSGVNLVTRWAIDADSFACESLRLNHPNIQVRNETTDDFLELLKHWDSLCKKFVPVDMSNSFPSSPEVSDLVQVCSDAQLDSDIAPDELEVSSLVDICYDDADGSGKGGLKFKVRWKGYGPSEDTWEPIEGLSNCQELIQEFVIKGFKNKILPLPGHVDVICGGPPCQGISGYNRFRTVDAPLTDERNRQLVVFMDIVEYLKPKFVLMENVMDILKFDKGSLGRYALSRLVHMNYQARVGIIAAGCYGLPQFRLRVFFWGAISTEVLPQFPLPSHDVVVRYWPPAEFERNVVAYDEGTQLPELEDAVFLGDAISDLPAVTNYESLDEMPYSGPPVTEFQKYIRSKEHGEEAVLYDHRPHQLFEDDYIRVCQIPRRKGANFRNLPGVIVGDDNVVRRDPTLEVELLPSGWPMVPEYTFTFEQGKSKRPFARLWWDETLPTIVTYPNCHSQAILHPEQDRVLTVRECARLQGFPDNYRFCGTVKKRYRQVGNAVAIPVAKALGFALGIASQKLTSKEHLLTLPPNFAYSNQFLS